MRVIVLEKPFVTLFEDKVECSLLWRGFPLLLQGAWDVTVLGRLTSPGPGRRQAQTTESFCVYNVSEMGLVSFIPLAPLGKC